MIEDRLKRKPDLICLAGYDLWHTSWFIDKYYPHIINVHPGDTVKSYAGLHWIPAARAIIAGEKSLRSTTFVVDQGGDTGPVLVQSVPLYIQPTLESLEAAGQASLVDRFQQVERFVAAESILTLDEFNAKAGSDLKPNMESVCRALQNALKEAGDWRIYPFAVHDLIARGRVELEGRKVYIDGHLLPVYGYRMDCEV